MMQRWKNVWAGGPVEKENLIKLKQEGTLVKLPEKSCKSKAVAGLLRPGLSTHTGVRPLQAWKPWAEWLGRGLWGRLGWEDPAPAAHRPATWSE